MRPVLWIALLCACAAQAAPNVLLLSVDTLRADFLGCYGSEWDLTPNLDSLAEKSLVFDDAVCETPLTGPSFAAMMTSRYPRMVGATRNGMRISDDARVVAEQFHEAGYFTFAVQSNWTLRGRLCGLDRGFERYDDKLDQRRWGFYKGERRAEEVTAAALQILRERPEDRPFFAWVHYSDPHAPYRYRSEYSPITRGLRNMNRSERVRVKYACEVAYTDTHIGKLLQALPEGTHIFFVADHGESLYEHDYLGHGRYLYQTCLHIPMMIYRPGRAPGRTDQPAQVMDTGPTLLALAGLNPWNSMLGRNLLGDPLPSDRPRFMETYGGAVPRLPGAKALLRHTSPTHQAVLKEGWKLIQPQSGIPELYFLPDDPGESRNVLHGNESKLAELRDLLALWNKSHPRGAENAAELSNEDIEALQALGYIE